MKANIQYEGASYGTGGNAHAPKYAIAVKRDWLGDIQLRFELESPAAGKGVGDAQGKVREVSLTLTPEAWRMVVRALESELSGMSGGEVRIPVNEER